MPIDRFPPVKYDQIQFKGGLDLVTPTLALPPGVAKDAQNFEVSLFGGYTRIAGYERFDGRASPSSAQYTTIYATLTGSVVAGNTITGATSGATAKVIFVDPLYLIVTRVTGAFVSGENIRVGASVVGIVSAGVGIAITSERNAYFLSLAADEYRTSIQPVPGSGPIRGVQYFNGVVFAFRDNAAGTSGAIYKSSATGWTLVPLGFQISFTTGSSAPAEGVTINGQTSGATAVLSRVALESGAYLGNTAKGRLILSSVTGNFTSGENLRVGTTVFAVAASTQTAITRAVGGTVEIDSGNFGGQKGTQRMYGADGVNQAFEFDGTVYVPISTGLTNDRPKHVVVHKNYLWLSYLGSVFNSSLGNPYSFDAITGANEYAVGEDVTAMVVQPGSQQNGAMAIFTLNNTSILYGSSPSTFNLVSYNVGTGAYDYTALNLNGTYYFNDRGVNNLVTTLNYGNFDTTSETLNLQPFIQAHRSRVSCATLNRSKSQYQVFFSDGYGLYSTFNNNQYLGTFPVLFPNPVLCISEGDRSDTIETSFFGSTNGYVYKLGVGTSFDGQSIQSYLTLVFNATGNSRVLKRYRKGSFEVTGEGYAQFDFSYNLSYASSEVEQQSASSYNLPFNPSFWDSLNWDSFFWDGRGLAPSEVEMVGTSENIQVMVYSSSTYCAPFTLNSFIMHYTPRRGLR